MPDVQSANIWSNGIAYTFVVVFLYCFFFLSILSFVYSKIVQSPERSSTTNIKYLCYILNSIGQFCFADSKYIVCVNLWC